MAELFSIGQPENEAERKAFDYLRAHLPDSYKLFTNLEISQGVEIYEIDLIILTPHCVYVVDIKNWHGNIDIYDPNWHPDNYQPFTSPLKKLRKHAKVISTAICDTNRARTQELQKVHIQASVLMTDVNLKITDYAGKDGAHVTFLDKRCIQYFKDKSYIPKYRYIDIKSYISFVEQAIRGKSKPKSAQLRYHNWQVEEKLSSDELRQYTEYRVKKTTMGMSGLTARLRVYKVDPLLEPAEREEQYRLITTAMLALGQLPSHQNILGIQDCFESPEHNSLVMVTEDVKGQVLSQHIKKQSLNWERKLSIIKDVLRGLRHIHKHKIVHRNITPDTILVTSEGQARLIGFDYARVSNRTSTIAEDIIEELEKYAAYQAIECQSDPGQASVASDLFSAGLVFYELLTNTPAFNSAEHIYECSAEFPVKPSQLNPQLSTQWDNWLQKMCAFDALDRYSNAGAALKELSKIAAPAPINIDISKLKADNIIDDRYRVIKQLGRPGSFAIAYHVLDTIGDIERVIKLVTRDRYSLYERVRQEYKTLQKVPEHPHIVKVIWSDSLKDGTPFILFEYLEGQDIQSLIESKNISLIQAVEVAKQTAEGLLHLHKHKVLHQDIKPSNLLLTQNGVRIIDFNIAVSDSDETDVNAGTLRYVPPDWKFSENLKLQDKIDRDLYALGIVFYECVTGRYPFEEAQPPRGKLPIHPHAISGCENLSNELVQLLMQMIAPHRKDRFNSVEDIITAINNISELEVISILAPEKEQDAKNLTPQLSSQQGKGEENYSTLLIGDGSGERSFPDKPIVLDPTGVYEIPPGYVPITTEVEWMRSFGTTNSPCWIKGQRLCDWAKEWLLVWDKLNLIAQEKQSPRLRIARLFEPVAVPDEWTEAQLLTLVTKLDSYPQENPIAHLLADVTQTDRKIWLEAPSVENLAAWLTIQVPQEYRILEKVWQQKLQHELAVYYQTDDKLGFLRRWLGIAEPNITELPQYPLEITNILEKEFDDYWTEKLYRTEAKSLDDINITSQQLGFKRIANLAYKVFENRPGFLNKVRENKIAPYLDFQQQVTLRDKQSPPKPEPLPIDASPKQALSWVTENYLPFRRWEIVVEQKPYGQRNSDRLADSFVQWILEHYPQLKFDTVENSLLNYSVAYNVQNLCSSNPVLWVVVDGLGWLDHIELLFYLTKNNQLAIESYIEPRFSILPTKTEYAKWSLYTQLLPSHASWVNDAGKGFAKMGLGKRYTDNRKAELLKDLKSRKHQLYCWDTQQFDELYHHERDWEHLYNNKRPYILEGIAKEILFFVKKYQQPENLQIVIASDHGQMLGISDQILPSGNKLDTKGRMAIGKSNDERLVVLDRERYGLPHDISVVKGAASLGAFNYTTDKKIIGSHGGLFPEEVVVGVSVLRTSVPRLPVLVTCSGKGEANKQGELTITIDNPNSVPLTNLSLGINEISKLEQPLAIKVLANSKLTFNIDIFVPSLPLNHQGDILPLTGELTFQFANAETKSVTISNDSSIVIEQLFDSGFSVEDLL
ncbi:MAG: protein kinase [Calothrix sp. C42_A2020_038]|nr:protein kinase [Calothrix sp. C42_A2020_038]